MRSRGFSLSLVVIFAYYILLTLGESLGERGVWPAALAMWLPNVLLTLLAGILLVRAARESFFVLPARVTHWLQAVRVRLASIGDSKDT